MAMIAACLFFFCLSPPPHSSSFSDMCFLAFSFFCSSNAAMYSVLDEYRFPDLSRYTVSAFLPLTLSPISFHLGGEATGKPKTDATAPTPKMMATIRKTTMVVKIVIIIAATMLMLMLKTLLFLLTMTMVMMIIMMIIM